MGGRSSKQHSDERAVAAIDAAYGNHPRSISRLHDDELLHMLSFLALKDLAQLVHCSRRFRHVARKERNRGSEIAPAVRDIPSLVRSSLKRHVASVLLSESGVGAHVNRATLQQLRLLPHLTKLDVRVADIDTAKALLPRWSTTSVTAAAEKLIAALPTQLRSFCFATCPLYWTESTIKFETLSAAFLTAAATMRQLTELRISHSARWDGMQLDALVALPQLRTLTIAGSLAQQNRALSGLRQLRQLRELTLKCIQPEDFALLCQPPHALQLEALRVDMGLGAHQMHALVQLPTLTELESPFVHPDAWPLLPQLPLLRRLQIVHAMEFTEALTSSLSSSLARCTALDELTLSVTFAPSFWQQFYGVASTEEERQAQWTTLLRSVPNLVRLGVRLEDASSLLAVLPLHLPRLERLLLRSLDVRGDVTLAQLAHPTLQQVDVRCTLTEEEVQALLRNPRLPQMRSCLTRRI
jgi:hypothetical protein